MRNIQETRNFKESKQKIRKNRKILLTSGMICKLHKFRFLNIFNIFLREWWKNSYKNLLQVHWFNWKFLKYSPEQERRLQPIYPLDKPKFWMIFNSFGEIFAITLNRIIIFYQNYETCLKIQISIFLWNHLKTPPTFRIPPWRLYEATHW